MTTQQIDTKQVKGLTTRIEKVDSMPGIKYIGNNLVLTDDGTLNATTGGSSVILYDGTGNHTDGAMTQKSSTEELAKKATISLDSGDSGKFMLADGSYQTYIDNSNIANSAVTTNALNDGAVTSAKLATGAVETTNIADANVTTAKIADGAVTSVKLASNAVITASITDANVTTAKIADSNVTTDKIADGAVTNAKLGDSSITAGKLGSNSVITAKLDDGAVTTAKLDDKAVTAGKIDFTTLTGNYSTSEQATPYTWINGKTIYKRTIDFGSLPNQASVTKSVNLGFTYDRIIKVETDVDNGGGEGYVEISSGNAIATGFNFYITATSINISTNSDRSSLYAYFTLYYTKQSS